MSSGLSNWLCSAAGGTATSIYCACQIISAHSENEARGIIDQVFFDKYGSIPVTSSVGLIQDDDLIIRWIMAQDFPERKLPIFGHQARSLTGYRICHDRFLVFNLIKGDLGEILPEAVAKHPPTWAMQRPIDRIISSVLEMFPSLPRWEKRKPK